MKSQSLKVAVLLPALLLLADCTGGERQTKPAKPSQYAFDVILKMSPQIEALLKKPDAGLVVDSWYYGDAAPAHKADADELNRIFLGKEDVEFPATARRLHLKGEPIDPAKLAETRDGQPEVIFSLVIRQGERVGDPDNELSCEYTGQIRVAQQQTPVIRCEFDTEHYWDSVSDDSASAD
jgi:hypothetical protein